MKMNGHGHANGNGSNNGRLSQLPNEMFSIIKSAGQMKNAGIGLGPRLGRLALPNKRIVATPHYLANTSRGVVPHITQDTFSRDTDIGAVYVALEDCEFAHYHQPDPSSNITDTPTYSPINF